MTDEMVAPVVAHGTGQCVRLDIVARDADGKITGEWHNPNDLITQQWAQFAILNILAQTSTLTVTDTTNTGRSIIGTPATITALTIQAGTGTTAASVTDYAIQTAVSGSSGTIAGTVNWITESSGSSGSFTITGTITNSSGSTVQYSELCLYVTNAAHTFAITHDVFAAVPVSNTGTLTITYTITNS